MKMLKLIITAAAMLSLVSSSAVYAGGFAPAEGLYIGGFVGAGTGIVQPKVTTNGLDVGLAGGKQDGGTFEATEGGLGLMGIEGGAWVGYGYKMGDLYAGLEGEMAAGDVEFKLTATPGIELDVDQKGITEVKATKDWTGGAFGRLGFYINQDSLLSARVGVLVSKFDVSYTGNSDTFYAGGPSFGVSLESRLAAIDPNLSLRMDTVYTDFLTSAIHGIGSQNSTEITNLQGHNSEVTGSALSARIGFTYSFLDVNSLF